MPSISNDILMTGTVLNIESSVTLKMNAPPCKVLPNNELLPVTDNRSRDFRFRMILSSVAVSRSGARVVCYRDGYRSLNA